tara:strand:- start:256 stop:531 length:276 start_codon:yes stop_codon:yes gene_type:complete
VRSLPRFQRIHRLGAVVVAENLRAREMSRKFFVSRSVVGFVLVSIDRVASRRVASRRRRRRRAHPTRLRRRASRLGEHDRSGRVVRHGVSV